MSGYTNAWERIDTWTHRLRVQGGWVYRYREAALCFVPGSAYPFAPEAQEADTSPPIEPTDTAPEAIGPVQAACGCGAPATAWFVRPGGAGLSEECCERCLRIEIARVHGFLSMGPL